MSYKLLYWGRKVRISHETSHCELSFCLCWEYSAWYCTWISKETFKNWSFCLVTNLEANKDYDRYLAKWLERLTAKAKVATVLGSIPASTDTGKIRWSSVEWLCTVPLKTTFFYAHFLRLFSMFRIRIRIHRIHMFLGLPDQGPILRGIDPDPSIIKQK